MSVKTKAKKIITWSMLSVIAIACAVFLFFCLGVCGPLLIAACMIAAIVFSVKLSAKKRAAALTDDDSEKMKVRKTEFCYRLVATDIASSILYLVVVLWVFMFSSNMDDSGLGVAVAFSALYLIYLIARGAIIYIENRDVTASVALASAILPLALFNPLILIMWIIMANISLVSALITKRILTLRESAKRKRGDNQTQPYEIRSSGRLERIGKVVKWIVLPLIAAISVAFLVVWTGRMVKDYTLTINHIDELNSITVREEDHVPEYDFVRITSYSEDEIEVYIAGSNAYYTYKNRLTWGGTARYSRESNGEWSFSENVTWSRTGTAEHLVWPYWHHAHYLYF